MPKTLGCVLFLVLFQYFLSLTFKASLRMRTGTEVQRNFYSIVQIPLYRKCKRIQRVYNTQQFRSLAEGNIRLQESYTAQRQPKWRPMISQKYTPQK